MVCVFLNKTYAGTEIIVAPSHVELIERFKEDESIFMKREDKIRLSNILERLSSRFWSSDNNDGHACWSHKHGQMFITNFPDVPVSEDGRAWVVFHYAAGILGVATDPDKIEEVKRDIQGVDPSELEIISELKIISGTPKIKSANKS